MNNQLELTHVNPNRSHVVTGGTGFIGSALILELLQQTNGFVFALVRPKPDQSPADRLANTLNELIDGYELPEALHHQVATRVIAIPGDIEQPSCAVSKMSLAALKNAEFWHCAASLQYMDRHREQIERTNVLGTSNVLELATKTECSTFNMVSTAYVVGKRRGNIIPSAPDLEFVNNCYEQSKIKAEELVSASGLRVRFLRPSVVIGHSKTLHSTSTDGLYGFIRNLTKFRNALERTQVGLSQTLKVSIEVDADGLIDLVPVDSVVEDAVALSNAGAPPGYYHLTNATSPRVGDSVRTAFEVAGLAPPTLVTNRESMTELDLKLQQRIDFYSSYMINPKRFDRSSVEAVLGTDARSGSNVEGERLVEFCQWFTDRLESDARPVAVAR